MRLIPEQRLLHELAEFKANAAKLGQLEAVTTIAVIEGWIISGRLSAEPVAVEGLLDRMRILSAELRKLVNNSKEVQCVCSPKERDSGHRIGCNAPELQTNIEKAEAVLAEYGIPSPPTEGGGG